MIFSWTGLIGILMDKPLFMLQHSILVRKKHEESYERVYRSQDYM